MISLTVEGNKLVDSEGKETILKGININSPGILKYEEHHDFLQDIKQIKKLRANSVRVPICPAYFQSKKLYCEEILDPIVSLCKKLGLYCLLDYHAQGNPIKGLTREPTMLINGFKKYDAGYASAKKAAEKLAKRYGKESHVLFEIVSSYSLDVTKDEYKTASSGLIKIIRKYSKNVVVISAVSWPQTLEYALDYNVDAANAAFGIMIYPGTTGAIKEITLQVKKRYPVIVTECGYENINTKEEVLAGTNEYAVALKTFMGKNRLSWFAWCYHPTRQPVILRSWNPEDLSEWGRFLKNELL